MMEPLQSLPTTNKLPAPPDETFSIIVIPDTQRYVKLTSSPASNTPTLCNPIFKAHVDWITQNIERQKIAFVSHVGDLVDQNLPEQWEVARSCLDSLHGLVPYGISPGNKDVTKQGDSSLYQQYFPASRFQNFRWYGGTFSGEGRPAAFSRNNANSFQLFSAASLEFLFLHLECNAPDEVLDWANQILTEHPQHRTIVTTHMYLGPIHRPQQAREFFTAPKGRMRWHKVHGERGNSPQQMWEKCFRRHPQLFLICCGDQSRTQAYAQSSRGESGNEVQEVLCDYAASWLRMYRFHPARHLVEVWTFNPVDETLCQKTRIVKNIQRHQFQFRYAMSKTG